MAAFFCGYFLSVFREKFPPLSRKLLMTAQSANSVLEAWKDYGISPEWNQETADEVGLAASKISVQWTNAVIPDRPY